jgi:hypothetical protein
MDTYEEFMAYWSRPMYPRQAMIVLNPGWPDTIVNLLPPDAQKVIRDERRRILEAAAAFQSERAEDNVQR